MQRFARAEQNLTFVLKGDKPVSAITRAEARAWRDMREGQGVAPTTIRREMNDIRSVINLANSELGAGETNPFKGLKLKKATEGRQKQRLPLDQETIDGVYADLRKSNMRDARALLRIWTLLDYTGARPSEMRMLRHSEIVLDHSVPHIIVQFREDRTLKSGWSERKIPLIGAALSVAKDLSAEGRGETYVFPRFASEGGMDRFSSSLSRRVRKFTDNPKHVPYSLRHNMKSRMRRAEVFPETAKAIEGHAYSAGQDASYGDDISLEQLQAALKKALAGYRGGLG